MLEYTGKLGKRDYKQKAIELRKAGLSYGEIMKQIPIAKSTLCDWLHSVQLAEHQKQRITKKKIAAQKIGAQARHQQRLDGTKTIIDKAESEIISVNSRELWLMGIMLYWAEGSKEKSYRPGTGIQFTNMDPTMIRFFLVWLEKNFDVKKEDIIFDIYIHQTHKNRVSEIINFWSDKLEISSEFFTHIYFKKSKTTTNRKNIDASYFGVIRLKVKSSVSLNRMIAGWTLGVVKFFR